MSKKTLFSFELEPGMIVADDIIDATGRLVLAQGQALDADTISKLEFFSISEVVIDEPDSVAVASVSEISGNRSSEEFKAFATDYSEVVRLVKDNLDNLAQKGQPVNADTLIKAVYLLINDCKTIIQVFYVMYNMEPTDEAIYHHSLNVAIISVILGRWLGYRRPDLNQLALAGIVHDIGKLTIPIGILNKSGKLTDEEFALIKNHVKSGYDIIKNQVMDARVKDAVMYHHERCDGTGYPFGSKSNNISDFAKIIAIADVYDAMTSSRSYRQGHCPFEVIRIFDSEGLSKYDPKFIMTFMENIVSAYLHNNVELSDGRIGEIVMINKKCLYKPIVKCENDFIDLYFENDLKIVRVL